MRKDKGSINTPGVIIRAMDHVNFLWVDTDAQWIRIDWNIFYISIYICTEISGNALLFVQYLQMGLFYFYLFNKTHWQHYYFNILEFQQIFKL